MWSMGDYEKNLSSKTQQEEEEEEIESPSSATVSLHHHHHHNDPAIIEALEGNFDKLGLEGNNEHQNDFSEKEIIFKEEKSEEFQYPLRPGEPDCSFYLRTGSCRYGSNCRFNHPHRNNEHVRLQPHFAESVKLVDQKERGKDKEREEYPERAGQPECKYYLKTGVCKYGKACRYHHPREKTVVGPAQQLNFLGLPIRPGEKECPFYMRMGSCKFATNCRFHHPDPSNVGGLDPISGYHNGGSIPLHSTSTQAPLTSWSLPGASNEPVPYLDSSRSNPRVMVTPSQRTQQNLERNGYQGPIYSSKGNIHQPSALGKYNSTRKTDSSTHYHHQQQIMIDDFPERPGERECQFFMKNGDCKYRSACRFHHPKNRLKNSPVLSPIGLPLRPDQAICSHYSHYGICKYGPACKYDHPLNYDGSSATAPPVLSSSGQHTPFDDSGTSGSASVTGYENGGESLIQQCV